MNEITYIEKFFSDVEKNYNSRTENSPGENAKKYKKQYDEIMECKRYIFGRGESITR